MNERLRVLIGVLVMAGSPAARADGGCEGECPAWRFDTAYVADVLSNVRGGIDRGTRYLDNLDLMLEIDGGRVPGTDGLKLFVYGLYNNGHAFSRELTGDVQTVSNIEAVHALRLMEAWADLALTPRTSLRVGLYDLNSEFDATESGALFLLSSHGIGPDYSQSGRNGPSIFPVAGFGARIRHGFGTGVTLQLLAAEGTPGDPDHPKRTTLRFDDGEGLLLAGEVQGSAGAFSKLALGGWRYTARFDDVLTTLSNGSPRRHRGNHGAYALAESTLRNGAGGSPQITAFVRFGIAAGAFNALDQYIGAGLVWTGPLRGRPGDQLGLAVASARNGDRFRRAMRLAGTPVGARETNIELTYRLAATDWLVLQPDLQYIVSPGMDPGLRNALVLGLRFELSWAVAH